MVREVRVCCVSVCVCVRVCVRACIRVFIRPWVWGSELYAGRWSVVCAYDVLGGQDLLGRDSFTQSGRVRCCRVVDTLVCARLSLTAAALCCPGTPRQ